MHITLYFLFSISNDLFSISTNNKHISQLMTWSSFWRWTLPIRLLTGRKQRQLVPSWHDLHFHTWTDFNSSSVTLKYLWKLKNMFIIKAEKDPMLSDIKNLPFRCHSLTLFSYFILFISCIFKLFARFSFFLLQMNLLM